MDTTIDTNPDPDDHNVSEMAAACHNDPCENLKMKPRKSILKASSIDKSSFRREASSPSRDAQAHFDEMNILATLHPADKDYGLMKIEEPKTPYTYYSDSEGEEAATERVRRVSLSEHCKNGPDPNKLTDKLTSSSGDDRTYAANVGSDDEDQPETEEQRNHRKAFELKRKQHYNEFQAVKLAKQLLQNDEEISQEPKNLSDNMRSSPHSNQDDANSSNSSEPVPMSL